MRPPIELGRIRTFILISALLGMTQVMAGATEPGTFYVTADTLNVRLSPSPSGKVTNRLDRGTRVEVLEVKSGWARVSRYYDGSLEGLSGQVARWVAAGHLDPSPPKPQEATTSGDSPLEKALRNSDDFGKYRDEFVIASKDLIERGRCSLHDFQESGGWVRSTNQKSKPIYFIYCGGFHVRNRLYLNVATGEVFQ